MGSQDLCGIPRPTMKKSSTSSIYQKTWNSFWNCSAGQWGRFLERLREYLVAPPGFEPGSRDPKSRMLGRYTTGLPDRKSREGAYKFWARFLIKKLGEASELATPDPLSPSPGPWPWLHRSRGEHQRFQVQGPSSRLLRWKSLRL